ncbi:MAG TPA: hypothetical protein VG935_00935 [Patescibacteria group bacterium]|nr:hypothetical protein [Patescibacteria group bacterium]
MKFVQVLLHRQKKTQRKDIVEGQRQLLIEAGREQFKKLVDQGLGVPVALL